MRAFLEASSALTPACQDGLLGHLLTVSVEQLCHTLIFCMGLNKAELVRFIRWWVLCENVGGEACNNKFMSLTPVDESWIGNGQTFYSSANI